MLGRSVREPGPSEGHRPAGPPVRRLRVRLAYPRRRVLHQHARTLHQEQRSLESAAQTRCVADLRSVRGGYRAVFPELRRARLPLCKQLRFHVPGGNFGHRWWTGLLPDRRGLEDARDGRHFLQQRPSPIRRYAGRAQRSVQCMQVELPTLLDEPRELAPLPLERWSRRAHGRRGARADPAALQRRPKRPHGGLQRQGEARFGGSQRPPRQPPEELLGPYKQAPPAHSRARWNLEPGRSNLTSLYNPLR